MQGRWKEMEDSWELSNDLLAIFPIMNLECARFGMESANSGKYMILLVIPASFDYLLCIRGLSLNLLFQYCSV